MRKKDSVVVGAGRQAELAMRNGTRWCGMGDVWVVVMIVGQFSVHVDPVITHAACSLDVGGGRESSCYVTANYTNHPSMRSYATMEA